MNVIYLVIPCYNEEEVLNETSSRLKELMKSFIQKGMIDNESRIVFVNDGSKDKTWEIISSLHNQDEIFSGINLSRNRGHQNALLAGLLTVRDYCDAAISLDADLQDDVNVIEKFIEKYIYEGYDIVYGVRNSRMKDTFFKRTTAQGFYKFMKIMGVEIINDHADYRLLSKRALEGLSKFNEVNLFLRGIVPMIGYNSTTVEYERQERFAGESKYPLKKMISFAIEGITSLSIKPIRFITMVGFLVSAVSFIVLIYSFLMRFSGNVVKGWTSIIVSIWFLGGIQLLSIGVIGEYIGKIYLETKARPRFIIKDFINK
ncbi:MAG: glycosyltransferase family 2 protein [Clostridia bacterium]|nr:glycosyltransferase family 2 protein [Clostridia bacterium]MCI2000572.1 glycosyltransferase family 2 protein [Clostridia bacterium]MCI2015028.1 glycosyltransferase family 2 protein [Clostridia bacterium]